MQVSKIVYKSLIPNKGHIGFVSCVIDDWLYLGNIAIFTRLNSKKIRLVFPNKQVGNRKIQLFFPLSTDTYYELENKI